MRGCTRASEGCRFCYAEIIAATNPAYDGIAELRGPDNLARWTGKLVLVPTKLLEFATVREPAVIFANSMSDMFHEGWPRLDIRQVFAGMACAPHHLFMALTKRADAMRAFMADGENATAVDALVKQMLPRFAASSRYRFSWPLKNVALGVSIESNEHMTRLELLKRTPAALRFVSLEPLLERLFNFDPRGLDLVVSGGESGNRRYPQLVPRPTHPDWVRDLRDVCALHGVRFHHKQWGGWFPVYPERTRTGAERQPVPRVGDMALSPDGRHTLWANRAELEAVAAERLTLMRLAREKEKAGRSLDGREHNDRFEPPAATPVTPAQRDLF